MASKPVRVCSCPLCIIINRLRVLVSPLNYKPSACVLVSPLYSVCEQSYVNLAPGRIDYTKVAQPRGALLCAHAHMRQRVQ